MTESRTTPESIVMDRAALPVIHACDVAVVGGSIAGVAAAVALSQAGRSVVLIESRTYLGREISATLRPWLPVEDAVEPSTLIAAVISAGGGKIQGGEIPLRMDAVKLCLEDLALAAGVRILYASGPVGLCGPQEALSGVIIANKSSRQVVRCRLAIDATGNALLCRLAGAEFQDEPAKTLFARTVEFEGVQALGAGELSLPGALGLADNRAVVHLGYRGGDHVLLEHRLELPGSASDAWQISAREARARRTTQALILHLRAHEPAFRQAAAAASSYELHGPGSPPMAGPAPDWAGSLGARAEEADALPLGAFAAPVRGLWCVNDAARLDEPTLARLREPIGAARTGQALGEALARHWEPASAPAGLADGRVRGAAARETPLQVREQQQPQTGRAYDMCQVKAMQIPVVRTAEVLVVGGGSSGCMAALTAAREGARTVLVDMCPGLGGTGTFGGIDLLWFPRPLGRFGEFYERISELQERLGLPRPQGRMPSYNIAARLWTLMNAAEDAGVEMAFNCAAFASIVEANFVRGVVVASPLGPVAVLADVVIDATGDGDVAAFAGARSVLGSQRQHDVMYALMGGSDKPGRFRNVKTSMLDVTNVEDYTRMVLAERRRMRPGLTVAHDHSVYLAPRESRHIIGDVTLTLSDQLLKRCWPDVVYVAFSNCDMKGQSSSDWHRMGLQCPNLLIEIPYRALLPHGLEGAVVVGKAYSATHDASAAPRMQPDLENLGAVAGHAAAQSLREHRPPRGIDVRALQERLVEETLLGDSALSRALVPLRFDENKLRVLIDSLDIDKPLHSYSDMQVGDYFEGRVPIVDVLTAGPRVVPLLEQALAGADGARQVLLAQALAAVGSQAGVPALVAAIEEQLSAGRLPGQPAEVRHAGLPPNQCAAPDAAYLLYSLGMARDARALPVWQRVVDLLEHTSEAEIVDRYLSCYYYVHAVCFGAERLGDPRAAPILRKLHSYRPVHSRQLLAGWQENWFPERLACLELSIGQAMARCGSAEGYGILIAYLDDVRAVLAERAHAELGRIAGRDLGKDAGAWRSWLAQHAGDITPAPWTGPTDPTACWDEDILIEASPDSAR